MLTALSVAEETKPTPPKSTIPLIHGVEVADTQIYTSYTIGCDNCGEGAASCEREARCDTTVKTGTLKYDWHVTCAPYTKGKDIKLPRGDDFDEDYDGCGGELTDIKYKKPSEKGCWFFVSEEDTTNDECGLGQVTEGFILDYSPAKQFSFVSGSTTTWEYGDSPANPSEQADPKCMLETIKWQLNSNSPLLCAQDHYWHSCTATKSTSTEKNDGDLNSVTWANNKLYQCSRNKETKNAEWNVLGEDKDHDLHVDNGKDDCEPYDLKQNPSICSELEELNDCKNDKKYAVCAQCINKDASEIAGDGKDNNCDGKDVADPDDDEKACTDQNFNVEGGTYYWMPDAPKSQQCCGDDPTDFGKIFQTDAGERICLNKQPKSVGSVKKVEDIAGKESCNGNWCAPIASSQNSHFHILTIKKPGQEAYDIVSNGEVWQECKENTESTLAIPVGDNAALAHGFQCYKEGDRWVWANCKPKAGNEQITALNNGIKDRVEGDGLFALPLKLPDEKDTPKPTITINIGDQYKPFYSDKGFDLVQKDGKQFLEAYVRFTNDKITYPATINLKIFGPKVDKEYIPYFDQPILGYAVNTPLLEPNRWIHVKIPLPTLYDVTKLEFNSLSDKNTIEVRNVYLTYGDNPKICSGQTSSQQTAWLSDLGT